MRRHSLPLLTRIGLMLFSGSVLVDKLIYPLPNWLCIVLLAVSALMLLLGLFSARTAKEAK